MSEVIFPSNANYLCFKNCCWLACRASLFLPACFGQADRVTAAVVVTAFFSSVRHYWGHECIRRLCPVSVGQGGSCRSMCCLFIPDLSMNLVLDKNRSLVALLLRGKDAPAQSIGLGLSPIAAACIEDFNSLASAYLSFTGASAREVPITSTGPYVNFVSTEYACVGRGKWKSVSIVCNEK